jgi:hypothetical protein
MIKQLEKLNLDDMVILAIPNDVDNPVEFTYHIPVVSGNQGFDGVAEIDVGDMVSG